MKRLAAALAAGVLTMALVAVAQADPSKYAIKTASASISDSQAGGHPDFSTLIELQTESNGELPATTSSTVFELPAGLLANPNAVPKCSAEQFANTNPDDPANSNGCPVDSQVGITEVFLRKNGTENGLVEPVYNLEPRDGEPARLGFIADAFPVFVDTELRSNGDYGATAKADGVGSLIPLISAATTIWGVPADSSHDAERLTAYESVHVGHPDTPSGKRGSSLVPMPFTLNPVRCGVAQGVRLIATPYVLPELHSEVFAPLPPNSGCGLLEFKPSLSIGPTSSQAETGSGLDVDLSFPTDGLEHPNLLAGDDQRKVEVALPEGMTVNPSQAAGGLGVCSEADFARETATSLPNEGCPETAKIGTVTATSPLLEEPAEGALFLAKPHENPFGTLLSIDMVLKVPDRGVIVKLPGRVEADPASGRLTTTFDEIPQLPVATFHLHFREGDRSPLVTPRSCGSYESDATFTSWGGHTALAHPNFLLASGIGGGPCPSGPRGFTPSFAAGSLSNAAAAHSSFYMRFSRTDADRELTRISATLPPGELAKLAGLSSCPRAAIDAAKRRSGSEERAAPSCPSTSRIGHLLAGAGVGPTLTYVPGELYLAGPYRGAPLSVVAIVPALAGPIDLGTVVTQQGLRLDPESGRATVEGASAEPLPRILQGIPLRVRDVRIYVDRPGFALNPTSCEPLATEARAWAGVSDSFSSPDAIAAAVSARFQAANCSRLPFKPRLSLTLKGSTKRTSHPRLLANLTAKPGEANIARAQVKLPKAAFLDNAHIKGICTRVQFAADSCPANSIYGKASAKTPLLDSPLKGAVYLRSSNNPLPDLVAKLRGPDSQPIEIDLAGRTDSVKGALRNTFEAVPDAPVSTFQLELFGGKRGLIELSSGLCKSPKASVNLTGQNGKTFDTRPAVRSSCKHRGSKK